MAKRGRPLGFRTPEVMTAELDVENWHFASRRNVWEGGVEERSMCGSSLGLGYSDEPLFRLGKQRVNGGWRTLPAARGTYQNEGRE